VAAVQDLAGAGVNGERRQRADRSDVVRLGVAPLGGKRSRDGLRVLLADGSRREPGDVTPVFRISSTQVSEGSRTLRGLIHPDNGDRVCCHLVRTR